ncbi:MAG: hydantoinase B/oxoprolinase family protein [Comamonadaceae bacterium]|nr:MAG: hydantoinase B/oxoprolinase family protein [Comamonadaceae bacterium]
MDPVKTAIMANRFQALADEASTILYRTAHTTFIKLVQDFQCALVSADGENVAYPAQSGVNVFIGFSIKGLLEEIDVDALVPGDIIVTNDPFHTDGLVTHMMDVTMINPIFNDGKLVAFGWSFVHASDIGGAVPGSIAPSNSEVFQEGLRIRPVKLYKAGQLNTEVRDVIMDNTRIPGDIWGDLQAVVAALRTMDRRVNELCARYGRDGVEQAMDDITELAEIKARAIIRDLPNSSYTFSDYVEGLKPGELTFLHLKMTIEDDEVVFDFTGTDPQVAAAYNIVSGRRTHPYIVQALLWYILTIDPLAPKNAGLLRPIRTIAPAGTLINAEFPAAGGSRIATGLRVYDCILGCLNQAIPDGLVAAGPGQAAIIVATGEDPINGGKRVTVINPLAGGGGGRRSRDGVDGVEVRSGFRLSVPTEITEVETVMRVRRYAIVPDTQAPGLYRGGAALELELENVGMEAVMTIRGMNRFHLQPWGVRGGAAGQLGSAILNPETPAEEQLGKVNVLYLKRGDRIRLRTPTGGGFGDPYGRDPQLVASDVERGVVSTERAREAYGVVLTEDGKVDEDQTTRLRASRPHVRDEAHVFDRGTARDRIDHIWPPEVRSSLAQAAMKAPSSLRHHLIQGVLKQFADTTEPVALGPLEAALEVVEHDLLGTSHT